MPNCRENVFGEKHAIQNIAVISECGFVYIFQPIFKVLLHRLLWPCCKYTLLLLMQSLLQCLKRFLACLPVELLSVSIFKRDFGYPPTVFAQVNRAFTVAVSFLPCHDAHRFLSI